MYYISKFTVCVFLTFTLRIFTECVLDRLQIWERIQNKYPKNRYRIKRIVSNVAWVISSLMAYLLVCLILITLEKFGINTENIMDFFL